MSNTKRDGNGLTDAQRDNMQEWMKRCDADMGWNRTRSIAAFNAMGRVEQRNIIGRVWFSRRTGNAISRPLLPAAS